MTPHLPQTPLIMLTLLTLFSLPYLIAAQQLSIQNINTSTLIDLYVLHNGNSTVTSGKPVRFTWDIYADNAPYIDAATLEDSSIEIMAGSAEAAGDEVVDVAVIHDTYRIAEYFYPANLPLGVYHARINSTLNTTRSIGQSTIQQLSARSPTIHLTTSSPIGCGAKVPPPFTNVTSPDSAAFTSMYITKPSAGYNVARTPLLASDAVIINLAYRDQRNPLGKGISAVTAQILSGTSSTPLGPPQSPADPNAPERIAIKFADVPMEVGSSYKIEIRYRNEVQDGAVGKGGEVSFVSEVFNVVSAEDGRSNCGRLSSSGSGGTGSGGSAGGSGGSGGAGQTGGGMRVLMGDLVYLPVVLVGLASVVV
ncbi:hypothetical protein B0H34DRAFT_799617 [Crassisporium funariophilum]|nr:hypothetical protein B0H34DRAFT_799617 [Crassisporium funariophilum]